MNEPLRKSQSRWLAKMQPSLPPAPSQDNPMETAWNEYDGLRGNYAAALSQITELHDICREQSHRVEVLETLQHEERGFFRNEIERLTRERDMLAAWVSEMKTRIAIVKETIDGAEDKALRAADMAGSPHHDEGAEVRQIVQGIADANRE